MRTPYFHVDAFTSGVFGGNPAGVCPLERCLSETVMQRIAAENNLSETAFCVRAGGIFDLRWFTPTTEVDLCGHATLATAFVLFDAFDEPGETITFKTQSGRLSACRRQNLIELDFPSRPPISVSPPEDLLRGLDRKPSAVLKARDYLAVYETEAEVAELHPNFDRLAALDSLGIIATGPGRKVDFVSRFFAPAAGVPEDPVTGSSHCTLIPFWAERLGKKEMFARQISRRGGELHCRLLGDRVGIAGQAVIYARGEIDLPDVGLL